MRREVVSVRRRSECHETTRCSCRFGCASSGSASASAPATGVGATLSSCVAPLDAVGTSGGGGDSGPSAVISARSVCCGERGDGEGRGEEDGKEDGAAVGRVEPKCERDDRVCCAPPVGKDLQDGAADMDIDSGEIARCPAVAEADATGNTPRDEDDKPAPTPALHTLPVPVLVPPDTGSTEPPNDDEDDGPKDGGRASANTCDAGPRA